MINYITSLLDRLGLDAQDKIAFAEGLMIFGSAGLIITLYNAFDLIALLVIAIATSGYVWYKREELHHIENMKIINGYHLEKEK